MADSARRPALPRQVDQGDARPGPAVAAHRGGDPTRSRSITLPWTGRELNPTPAVQGLSAYRRNRPGREQPALGWPRPYTQGVADKPKPSSEFRDMDEPVSLAPLDPEE